MQLCLKLRDDKAGKPNPKKIKINQKVKEKKTEKYVRKYTVVNRRIQNNLNLMFVYSAFRDIKDFINLRDSMCRYVNACAARATKTCVTL